MDLWSNSVRVRISLDSVVKREQDKGGLGFHAFTSHDSCFVGAPIVRALT
jgi:hypothetical protein